MFRTCLFFLFVVGFAHKDFAHKDSAHKDNWHHGNCVEGCEDFVNCLYNRTDQYADKTRPNVDAMELTWDCLMDASKSSSWIVQMRLTEATQCTRKIFEKEPREDVEDCYADNVYGPFILAIIGHWIFWGICMFTGLLYVLAFALAHFRCYTGPRDPSSCSFCCCKFWCPLAAVVSVDRYQDSTAIASMFSWCGCIYTFCCWNPKPANPESVQLVNGQYPQQGATWGV